MAMAGSNGDADPGTAPDFWAIRNSLLPATPEMEQAADLLNAAADMILADRDEQAVTLIQQADITALFDVREQACNRPPISSVLRLRKVATLLPKVSKEQRAPLFKSESALGEAVFRRDGWRCRYCGCRIIPSRVARWMDMRLPGAIRWDRVNELERHAGFWTLWGSVDHVVPRVRGGRNEAENLVTACVVCQFAKDRYTLEELGLADPRARRPVLDGWDGLTRLVTKPTRPTPAMDLEPRQPSPQPSRGPAASEEPTYQRSKSTPRAPLLSPAEYYAQLETRRPHSAQPLQVFLASLEEAGVVVEFLRSVVLRFPVGVGGGQVSAGCILTDGRVYFGDAYYYAQKHGHRDIGERYLAAVANLSDGEVRAAGRNIPEVFSRGGRQINVTDLLSNAALWKNAISDFVSGMRPAMHTDILREQ